MNHWIEVCAFESIEDEDVVRFDHAGKTFAIYRLDGRFDICTGRALGAPVCTNLVTYPATVEDGVVRICT